MALPPTIPSSFVPHAPVTQRSASGFNPGNLFALIAYAVLGLMVLAAVGVFAYGQILSSTKQSKDAALAKAEAAIDPATVQSFVRLRDRLTSAKTLLADHLALTPFFGALEQYIPSTVRVTSLHIAVDTIDSIKVEGTGVAKNFNALAAASESLSGKANLKDLIFSSLAINLDGSVSFKFTAALSKNMILYTPAVAAPAATSPTAP